MLALDLGARRIGVAVSDEWRFTVRTLGVITHVGPRKSAAALRALAHGLEAVQLVVGLPLLPSGDEGPSAVAARAQGEDLARRLVLPLAFVDESHTTLDAASALLASGASRPRRRRAVDAMAAVLILEAWLEEQRAAASLHGQAEPHPTVPVPAAQDRPA